ncbi:MAG: argininosuccinate lyase, partial [Treponema sp.]|nr:argininosuccinate lyase [Treponema sp.]
MIEDAGLSRQVSVLWAGRLTEKPEQEAFAFQSSIAVDRRLAQDDIRGSRAHVVMLSAQGIIPAGTAEALDAELARISGELEDGTLLIDPGAEDIHSFIEGVLTARLGDPGRMVHAGRSRNDQVALDIRLYLRRTLPELRAELARTVAVLLDRAEEHTASVMPGYTHLQRAQPLSLGHWLCAWACALGRDWERLGDALGRLDECPLGSGALAGSTLPLDRGAVAKALGFDRPSLNSMDSVADRDFALEIAAACAIIQTHLSRFCEDMVIWSSEESGFVDLGEAWSTGSSIMPQKKNPDFAELIRGKAGRSAGNLMTLLTLLKGLPYAYDKDLQEDKEALFDSLDTAQSCLRIFRGMTAAARFNTGRMEAACTGGFVEATDAAEYLVLKGLPFRTAPETVAL